MTQHTPVEVDKKALKEAEVLWANYTEWTKRGIIAIVVLLCILGIAFV